MIKKALKINPYSSDANFYMGLCYEKSGCFKKAICFYNISTSLESCVECHLRLSCCYQVLGEDDLMFDEAIKAYNVNKYDNDAVYNLTRILIKRKRYTEAYEILNNDVFICSSDLGILKNLLFSSIKVREFKMAESIAKYLIELDSDNSLAIDFLGQCQPDDGSMIDKK